MILYACRPEGQETFIATVGSFEQATNIVDAMEDDNTWPEGSDAVVKDGDKSWVYTDRWEPGLKFKIVPSAPFAPEQPEAAQARR